MTLSDPSGEFVSCECGSNRTAPTKTKSGWHQTKGTVTPGRYVGQSGDPWQLTQSRIQAYGTARALGENHAASKRVQASHDALVAEYQKQRTAPAKSFADMALGLWRVGVFDERSCTQGSKGACAAEIAMAIPILKVAKPLKYLDDALDAGSDARRVAPETNKIYSSRALRRMADAPDSYHNFPGSFDDTVFSKGTRTVNPNYFNKAKPNMGNDSIQYRLPGEINGRTGTYEIFTRPSASGRTEMIIHRFFRPDPS